MTPEQPEQPHQPDHPEQEPALVEMRRALWWAGAEPRAAGIEGTRDALRDLAAQVRVDATVVFPIGETTLQSPSRLRTWLKTRIFRMTRPVSWRYDRLIADHAELTAALAAHLLNVDNELERLRSIIDEKDAAE
jgi:hypothetical protein